MPPLSYGYCHISRLTDDHVDKIGKRYKLTSKHRARILHYNTLDGLAELSLAPSVLSLPYIRYDQMQPGDTVTGTIISVEQFGMIVQLSPRLKGLCPSMHFADVSLKHPEKRLKKGARVVCKVLKNEVVAGKRKLILTHKKTLVKSDLVILADYEAARVGDIAHGYVSSVRPSGVFVSFYGEVAGRVRLSELSDSERIEDPARYFTVGQVVRCRVLNVKPAEAKMSLSFRMEDGPDTDERRQIIAGVASGSTVALSVTAVCANELEVSLSTNDTVRCSISAEHLTDHPSHANALLQGFRPGDIIEEAVVLAKEGKRSNRLVLSCKPLLKAAAAAGELPTTAADMQPDTLYPGYVRSVTSYGVFIGFIHGVVGLAMSKDIDKGVDPTTDFVVGQTVVAKLLRFDEESGRANLTLALTAEERASLQADHVVSYFGELDRDVEAKVEGSMAALRIGQCVQATIQTIKPYGAIVNVTSPAGEEFPGFVSTEQAAGIDVTEGVQLPARILDIDPSKNVVDLTVQPPLVAAGANALKPLKASKKPRAATIELVKEDYMVLSLPKGRLAFAATKTANNSTAPFDRFRPGGECEVLVVQAMKTGPRRLLVSCVNDEPIPSTDGSARTSGTASGAASDSKVVEKTAVGDVVPGSILSATVSSVRSTQVNLDFASGIKGRVHVTEVVDDGTDVEGSPLARYTKGASVKVKVIGQHDSKTHAYLAITHRRGKSVLECTARPAEVARAGVRYEPVALGNLKPDQVVTGYVQEAQADSLWVCLSPHVRGRVFGLHASQDPIVVGDLFESFPLGRQVQCRVLEVNAEANRLDLAINSSVTSTPKVGDVYVGKVVDVQPDKIKLQVGPRLFGWVHVTDCADKFTSRGTKAFAEGQLVRSVVVDVPSDRKRLGLSLRPSRVLGTGKTVNPEVSFDDIQVDQIYSGFINNVGDRGAFVALGRDVTARVLIANLSDSFIKDYTGSFPPGKFVTGRVMSVDKKRKKIDLSLKQ